MKKLFQILFIAVYLFLNVGMVFTAECCMVDLKPVKVETVKSAGCECCCDHDNDHVCGTEFVEVKLNDNQLFDFNKIFKALNSSILQSSVIEFKQELTKTYNPLLDNTGTRYNSPIYLTNCIFLI